MKDSSSMNRQNPQWCSHFIHTDSYGPNQVLLRSQSSPSDNVSLIRSSTRPKASSSQASRNFILEIVARMKEKRDFGLMRIQVLMNACECLQHHCAFNSCKDVTEIWHISKIHQIECIVSLENIYHSSTNVRLIETLSHRLEPWTILSFDCILFFGWLYTTDYEFVAYISRWTEAFCGGSGPSPRSSHASSIYQEILIVLGGQNQGEVFSDCYMLDLKHLVWHQVTFLIFCLCMRSKDCLLVGQSKSFHPFLILAPVWSDNNVTLGIFVPPEMLILSIVVPFLKSKHTWLEQKCCSNSLLFPNFLCNVPV